MLIPVFSLRRDDDLGVGDTRALKEMVDWAAEHRVGFLQLLPINETGGDNSPYNAISSVALDPLLLDLEAIPEIGIDDIEAVKSFQHSRLFGLDVNSGFEDSPAVKNVVLVNEFLKSVRQNKDEQE